MEIGSGGGRGEVSPLRDICGKRSVVMIAWEGGDVWWICWDSRGAQGREFPPTYFVSYPSTAMGPRALNLFERLFQCEI